MNGAEGMVPLPLVRRILIPKEKPQTTIHDLPTELIVHIFSYFHLKELFLPSLTCKSWEIIATNRLKSIFYKELPDTACWYESKKTISLANRSSFLKSLIADKRLRSLSLKDQPTIKEFKGNHAITHIQVEGSKLYSRSRAGNLNIWDQETQNELELPSSLPRKASFLEAKDTEVYIGSWEESLIYVWDSEKNLEINKIKVNTETRMTCLQVLEDKIYTGSIDGIIRILDKETGKEENLFRLQGQSLALQYKDGRVYGLSSYGKIHIWDLKAGIELSPLKGRITCFQKTENRLLGGSFDGIHIWDSKMEKELKTIKGISSLQSLQVHDRKIIAGSLSGTIHFFDETETEIKALVGHKDSIKCLKLISGILYSGSADRTIRVWDFNPNPLH